MSKIFIFPTYNESETIHSIVTELIPHLDISDLVIIADDSEYVHQERIVSFFRSESRVKVIRGPLKSGRGGAVWRSLELIHKERYRQDISFVIEADSDGSHSVKDILRIANCDESKEFVVGSRYLPESKIIGWSASRRSLSKLLNFFIPRLLGIEVKDITNGLRRYSNRATKILLESEPSSSGFIYLSEQALTLTRAGIIPFEIPIQFESRIVGKTSVGLRELVSSLVGLLKIVCKK